MLKIVLVVSVIVILSGCASDARKAGERIGAVNAGVILPSLPPRCKQQVQHAPLATGSEAIIVLKRERAQLDIANTTIAICAQNYETLKREFEQKGQRNAVPK